MALLVDADAEQIDHGSDVSLDDIAAGTYILWGYFNSIASNGLLIVKSSEANGTGTHLLIAGGANGNLEFYLERAGGATPLRAKSNTAPLQVDAWNFAACGWDFNGVNGDQQLYWGDLNTLVAEVGGYVIQTVGAGVRDTDANDNLLIGSWGDNPAWPTTDIVFAVAGIWNRKLTLAEIKQQQYRPHPTSGCVLLTHYGYNGVGTQADLSGTGNTGTVTDATLADHVPLGPFFGWDSGLPIVVAVVRQPRFGFINFQIPGVL